MNAKETIEIEIREASYSNEDRTFWLAIVTTKAGRRYFVVYTGYKPSLQKVTQAWKGNRKAFEPYQ